MKKYLIYLVLATILLLPGKSEAIVPFGGYNLWAMPCTCTAGMVWYVWYAPLLSGTVPMAGPLAVGVPPTALWFLNYDPLIPTTWSKGFYMPGVQSCWQPIGTGCAPWPVLGHVYFVGSSLPGGTP
jgi:hypothetical protein